jgi:cullin 1
MAILLLFNEKDTYTYEDMISATQLSAEVMDQALAVILKAKVLLMAGPPGEKPGVGKSFSLNYDFKSKKIRVNLNLGGVKEAKQEETETNKTIEEDRKLVLQVRKPRSLIRQPTICWEWEKGKHQIVGY